MKSLRTLNYRGRPADIFIKATHRATRGDLKIAAEKRRGIWHFYISQPGDQSLSGTFTEKPGASDQAIKMRLMSILQYVEGKIDPEAIGNRSRADGHFLNGVWGPGGENVMGEPAAMFKGVLA